VRTFAAAFLLVATASAEASLDGALEGAGPPAALEPGSTTAPLAKPGAAEGGGTTITFSGFQVFEDGRSRLTVHMTGSAAVEASYAGKKAEYLLRGVRIPVRNNKNALLTRHFASVVTSVRFVADSPPKGRARGKKTGSPDTRLIVEMREAVRPTHRMDKAADGSTLLVVDFPRPSTPPPPEPDPAPPTARPAE